MIRDGAQGVAQRFSSIGQGTDRGRHREHNEDSLRVEPTSTLFVVADGMGGHAAGEVASQIAADAVLASVTDRNSSLVEALAEANDAVLAAAEDGRGAPGMGTTCVAARLTAHELAVAWVGDSRAYRFRGGELEQLSRDHSQVQSLVDAGLIAPEQAALHPERHILARALGLGELTQEDTDARTLPLASGDRVLLCSDGLTGELDDRRIATLLAEHADDQQAVDALIEAALAAGGHDNVTVIVATAE